MPQGRVDGARAMLESAFATDRADVRIRNTLARVRFAAGDFDAGFALAKSTWEEIAPNNAFAVRATDALLHLAEGTYGTDEMRTSAAGHLIRAGLVEADRTFSMSVKGERRQVVFGGATKPLEDSDDDTRFTIPPSLEREFDKLMERMMATLAYAILGEALAEIDPILVLLARAGKMMERFEERREARDEKRAHRHRRLCVTRRPRALA